MFDEIIGKLIGDAVERAVADAVKPLEQEIARLQERVLAIEMTGGEPVDAARRQG